MNEPTHIPHGHFARAGTAYMLSIRIVMTQVVFLLVYSSEGSSGACARSSFERFALLPALRSSAREPLALALAVAAGMRTLVLLASRSKRGIGR